MIIHDCKQYSEEWWTLRRGVPTASNANKILTPTGKVSAQAEGLLNVLVTEALGCPDDPQEPTEWMLRGTELEPEARAMFELEQGLDVTEVGFITNDSGTSGCSPDGLVEPFTNRGGQPTARAGFEVKCPKASTHIGYLRDGGLPAYYKPQINWSMAVTGIRRWWFVSYFPELEPLIIQVEWSEYTDAVAKAMTDFSVKRREAFARFGL